MKGKAIYYREDNKRLDNKKDSRGKAQSFIYTSDILFTDNSVDRKSL